MKAVLLADTKTELYSTDLPPLDATALVGDEYHTANCGCHISDVACLVWYVCAALSYIVAKFSRPSNFGYFHCEYSLCGLQWKRGGIPRDTAM